MTPIVGVNDPIPKGCLRGKYLRGAIQANPCQVRADVQSEFYRLTAMARGELSEQLRDRGYHSEEITINPLAVLVADQQEKGIFMNKKVVMVTFDNDLHSEDTDGGRKLYSFFTDIEDIAIGDKCVVDCDRGGQLVVVLQVEGLERIQIEKAVSWIVDRIDVPNHKLRLEKQAKAQEILNRLDEGVKQMERVQIYKTMAQCDPAMGILMRELHELDPSAMPAAMVTALPAPSASASDDDFGTETQTEVLS